MTIKGRRAEALRKMDHEEAHGYMMGGCVDETFSPDAAHAALASVADRVDLSAFNAFFGRRLGSYRGMLESRQGQPSVADELALIAESVESVQQVRLRLEHLPPDADAHINLACWKRRHELFHDFRLRLDADLRETQALLALAEREIEKLKGKSGRKSASSRDWLLHDVAHHLGEQGIGKVEAAGAAAGVLRAAGVDAPDDPAEARKLVRSVEHVAGE